MPASLVVVGVEGPIGVAVGLVVVGGTAAGCCTFVVVVVVGSVPVLVAGAERLAHWRLIIQRFYKVYPLYGW